MNTGLTQERLKELLEYNPDTGVFVWIDKRNGAVNVGDIAGHVEIDRRRGTYIRITIDHIKHSAHRLAFLYMTRLIPNEIDHINRDGTDNRWSNLRDTCRVSNNRNKGRKNSNKSGITGVRSRGTRWIAEIRVGGKKKHLYQGVSKHDAILARYHAEVELGWHESNSDTDAKRYIENLTVNQNVQP